MQLAVGVSEFLLRIVGNPEAAFDTANQAFREGVNSMDSFRDDLEMFGESAAAMKALSTFMKEIGGGGEEERGGR